MLICRQTVKHFFKVKKHTTRQIGQNKNTNWSDWSYHEIMSNIFLYSSVYLSFPVFPPLVVFVLLCLSVTAECYMVLSPGVAVISSCSPYQLSSLL